MPWNRNKQIERVVLWHRRVPKGFVYAMRNVAGWLAIGALIFNLILSSRAGLGVFLIAGGVWAAAGAWKKFFEWYKNPPLGASLAVLAERLRPLNAAKIFPLFDFNARQILLSLAKGGELSRTQALVAIGTSHISNFFFARTGISRDEYLSAVRTSPPERPFSPEETSVFFEKALGAAIGHGHEFIRPVDILAVLFDEVPAFANLLRNAELKAEDLDNLYHWEAYQLFHRRRSWTNRLTRGGIGKTWTYGYTPTLDRFAEELQVSSELEALHVQAHGQEILELENALSKHAAANAVLVGEPGVGAMTTVLGFAARVGEGRSVRHLNFKRVLKLNLDAVLSERRERILEVLGRILREAELAGNVILVIDSVHLYLTPGATDPNIVEVLLPYIKSTPVHFIGLTTPGSYRRSVLTQSIIATLFERIDINEPDRKTMIRILEDYVTHREGSFGVTVRYQAIAKTVDLAAEYMVDKLFPAKGLELLEEALIEVSRRGGERVLKPEDVEALLRSRLAVPVGEPSESEKKVLLRLEEVIHERVINQNEAVAAVADAMRRARAGVTSREKPIGTFLFLGPTGVGKTETAKAVAQAYFGSAESMIRLDMSEYQKPEAIDRIIGSPDGREVGQLAAKVREHPFSLILLDEIEKAHSSIHDILLQILDEGRATDVFGRPINFRTAILIATSNAGAEFIREAIVANADYETLRRNLIENVLKSGVFKPEFINRFDAVIVFKPLDRKSVEAVSALMLRDVTTRLYEDNYLFQLTPELIQWVAQNGYSKEFGGRALKRFIQDRLESVIAKKILAGRYPKGTPLWLRPEDLGA